MVCWCQGITYTIGGVRECKAPGGSKKVSFSFMVCSECQFYHQSNRVGRLKDEDAWSALPADIKGPIQENIEKFRLIDAKATKKRRRDLVMMASLSHTTEETGQYDVDGIAHMNHHLPLDAAEPRLELELRRADNIMAVEASFVADDVDGMNLDDLMI